MIHPTAIVESGAVIGEGTHVGPFSEIKATARIGANCHIERAVVEGEVGDRTKVWRFAHIMDGARIGKDCMIAANVFISDGTLIGDGTRIQNNTCVSRGTVIGKGVYIGATVNFCNSIHPDVGTEEGRKLTPIVVMDGASIGSNVAIIGGVEIGKLAQVGAGAVVTKRVPDGALFVGIPAREMQRA